MVAEAATATIRQKRQQWKLKINCTVVTNLGKAIRTYDWKRKKTHLKDTQNIQTACNKIKHQNNSIHNKQQIFKHMCTWIHAWTCTNTHTHTYTQSISNSLKTLQTVTPLGLCVDWELRDYQQSTSPDTDPCTLSNTGHHVRRSHTNTVKWTQQTKLLFSHTAKKNKQKQKDCFPHMLDKDNKIPLPERPLVLARNI